MKGKILIFGKGFIGERLSEAFGCGISGKRICALKDAEKEIRRYRPKVIINCIGYIGRNVDDCELDQDNTLLANTFVPIILAEAALRYGIKLVHISSGCIYHFDYSKDRPITENKTPDFFDLYYSRSKIYSERALEVLSGKFNLLIVRLRVPLDSRPHPRNIIDKLIKYRQVIDIPNSITYIPDFIKAIKHLIKINAAGIYNIANKGGLRYPQLMDVYRKYRPDFAYKVIDYKKLHMVRTNLVLSTKKLENTGFKVRNIHEVLEECVKSYLKY
ncbi:MAG: sugar nucleotide-binding protein [Candidatus Omnitrophota bacterium]